MEPTLTNFEKFHPPQKKIPPPRLLISLLKCLILMQNLMTIFLTIILSYKTLFYLKNWCLLPPPHLVIFHFWHPSTFIPGSTFIREMRVYVISFLCATGIWFTYLQDHFPCLKTMKAWWKSQKAFSLKVRVLNDKSYRPKRNYLSSWAVWRPTVLNHNFSRFSITSPQ